MSDPLTGPVGLMVDLEDPTAPHIVGGNGRGFGSIFGEMEFRFLRDGLMIFRVPPPLSDASILNSRSFTLDLSAGMNRGGHDLLGFNPGSRIVLLKNGFDVIPVPHWRGPDGGEDDSDDSSDE